ncbi:hypothetical protein [Hyphomicrobium sp.]|uniref:hypothetical protein n=1 Tax=Hyphomicrobium sp. TaxID=82 RepID=UPI000FAC1D29|nr:hypothetical protein [Hyphomicrobium sp.]RUO99471.1 MAG: hypothetical protein EKK30_06130 [Hyphomicrobium sp.]
MIRYASSLVLTLLTLAALTGCASNAPQLQSMSIGQSEDAPPSSSSSAPSPANNPGAPEESRGVPVPGAVGSATEIYSSIARGAMACWFAVNGPLKKDYIFHAAADAPSRGGGGKAVITIHQRDPSQPNPRGPKAYVVEILPTGESSARVTVENRKMSDTYASAMKDDIARWSKDEQGCVGANAVAGWAPSSPQAPPATAKTAKKSSKAKQKAAQAKPAAQSPAAP